MIRIEFRQSCTVGKIEFRDHVRAVTDDISKVNAFTSGVVCSSRDVELCCKNPMKSIRAVELMKRGEIRPLRCVTRVM